MTCYSTFVTAENISDDKQKIGHRGIYIPLSIMPLSTILRQLFTQKSKTFIRTRINLPILSLPMSFQSTTARIFYRPLFRQLYAVRAPNYPIHTFARIDIRAQPLITFVNNSLRIYGTHATSDINI